MVRIVQTRDATQPAAQPRVAVVERGHPDLDHEMFGIWDHLVEVVGDTSVQPHPTRVLLALLEECPAAVAVRSVSLQREDGQGPWIEQIDRAIAAGVHTLNLSMGLDRARLEKTWPLWEPALQRWVTDSGANIVAPCGNASALDRKTQPVTSPACCSSVIAVAGVVRDDGAYQSFPWNRSLPLGTNMVCALAQDPSGGPDATSFAAPRIAGMVTEIVERLDANDRNPDTVRAILLASARKVAHDPFGYFDPPQRVGRSLGGGLPNRHRMVRCIERHRFHRGDATQPLPLREPPRASHLGWAVGLARTSCDEDAPKLVARVSQRPAIHGYGQRGWQMLYAPRNAEVEVVGNGPWSAAWTPV